MMQSSLLRNSTRPRAIDIVYLKLVMLQNQRQKTTEISQRTGTSDKALLKVRRAQNQF